MRLPVSGCGPHLRAAMIAVLLGAGLSGCHYAVSHSYGIGYYGGHGSGYHGHIKYRFSDHGYYRYGHKYRYHHRFGHRHHHW